jgi:hypothetical protein
VRQPSDDLIEQPPTANPAFARLAPPLFFVKPVSQELSSKSMKALLILHRSVHLRTSGLTLFIAALLAGLSLQAAPVNDNRADAILITTSMLTNAFTGSNLDATSEPGDPQSFDFPGFDRSGAAGLSVWWRFYAGSVNRVTINTAGSSFDTQLGVYTNGPDGLVEIASNEDIPGSLTGTSEVTFTTRPGALYYILIDGYDVNSSSSRGDIRFTIRGLTAVGLGAPTLRFGKVQQTEDSLEVNGTVQPKRSDDPITGVRVRLNGGEPFYADGTTSWHTTLTLNPGWNTVSARALTQTGSESAEVSKRVFYLVTRSVTVETNGYGRVTPNLNGKRLAVASRVTMRATPGPDQLFTGWSGSTNSTNATLAFTLQDDMNLVANFIPDPFVPVRGNYVGLVMPTSSAPTHQNSGSFTLTVDKRNSYSARFVIGGRTYVGSGKFNIDGHADLRVQSGRTVLTGSVQLDLNGGSDMVTGTITDGSTIDSAFTGNRAVFSTKKPAPFAGRHNLAIANNSDVGGNGFGSVLVTATGNAVASIKLGDGSVMSQNVPVSKNGDWPFFASLYSGRGSILGWVRFANQPDSSLTGTLNWFRPASNTRAYPGGFSTTVPLVGSLFISPPTAGPLLRWTDGVVQLANGGLADVINIPVKNTAKNVITNTDGDVALRATVNVLGSITGSFTQPGQRPTTLSGVVLPRNNSGAGYFAGTPQNGSFSLQENPDLSTNTAVGPASLNGNTMALTFAKGGAAFKRIASTPLSFGDSTVSADPQFGTADYNYSASSGGGKMAELNIIGGKLAAQPTVIRLLLNYTSNTSGDFLAEITAGGAGKASGTFTLNP